MKTNLSTKTITGISLMALFIVGCSGGAENSTRPSFQSPGSSRSFPLSGGTSSSVTPTAPAESNVSGNEEPAAPQTAAAEDGNADIQEAIDAANAAAAAANKAASSSDGAQTAGIVAAALAGVGALLSVGGDYLVNKKSSERDDKLSSEVSGVGQKVDRNLGVGLANQDRVNRVTQQLDAIEAAINRDAELARTRHNESMSATAEITETLEFAKKLLLERVETLATAEQVTALTEEIKEAASREDLERVQTKLIEAFEFQTKKEDMVIAVISRLSADSEQAPDLMELLLRIRAASNESELASIMQPYEAQLLHRAGIQVVTNPTGAPCFEECTPAEELTPEEGPASAPAPEAASAPKAASAPEAASAPAGVVGNLVQAVNRLLTEVLPGVPTQLEDSGQRLTQEIIPSIPSRIGKSWNDLVTLVLGSDQIVDGTGVEHHAASQNPGATQVETGNFRSAAAPVEDGVVIQTQPL